jgi:ABC-2 type transport system permease protein
MMPIIQLLILANAADFEVKNIYLHVIDKDLSPYSRELISKFSASPYFKLVDYSFSRKKGMDNITSDKADLILEIPFDFNRDIQKYGSAKIFLTLNAINGQKAGIAQGYAQNILLNFNQDLLLNLRPSADKAPAMIRTTYSNWYNPELDYYAFMVPGILVLLVTMLGMFLCAMNIVKEKEVGTIEQLNVSPISRYQFIIGKLFPFWILGLVELGIGLILAVFVFRIQIVGSIGLIFLFAGLYLFVILGFGLLISTITQTQQQAMFIAWFFLIVFILLSGLFTPIESMPDWAQRITLFNPIRYFVDVMRMVILKGSSIVDILTHIKVMIVYSLVINTLAVLNYRKTT